MGIRSLVVLVLLALTGASCAARDPADQSVSSRTSSTSTTQATTTSTTTAATVMPSSVVSEIVELPDWVSGFPLDLAASSVQPDSLSFAESYVDPGGHYRFAPGLEWELVEVSGLEAAPQTQWSLGDIGVITGSVTIPDTTLPEFVEIVSGEVLFESETHALVHRVTPDEVQYQLLVSEIDRLAFIAVGFPGEPNPNTLAEFLPAMLSFERTPWDESCLLYTSPSPRDQRGSRMPSSA